MFDSFFIIIIVCSLEKINDNIQLARCMILGFGICFTFTGILFIFCTDLLIALVGSLLIFCTI